MGKSQTWDFLGPNVQFVLVGPKFGDLTEKTLRFQGELSKFEQT